MPMDISNFCNSTLLQCCKKYTSRGTPTRFNKTMQAWLSSVHEGLLGEAVQEHRFEFEKLANSFADQAVQALKANGGFFDY